jgi:hypothetical protein
MPFKTEQHLFEQAVVSPFIKNMVDTLKYPTYAFAEPKGLFGIPDLVVANVEHRNGQATIIRSFAFEMKLSNWKRAITQAYRYRAFANLAFVVIDRHFLKPALDNIEDFVKSNIGLISIDQSGFIHLHHTPEFEAPYCYELEVKFRKMVIGEKVGEGLYSPKLMVWNSTATNAVNPQ